MDNKIVIVVEGGNVQSVFVPQEILGKFEVWLADYDDKRAEDFNGRDPAFAPWCREIWAAGLTNLDLLDLEDIKSFIFAEEEVG